MQRRCRARCMNNKHFRFPSAPCPSLSYGRCVHVSSLDLFVTSWSSHAMFWWEYSFRGTVRVYWTQVFCNRSKQSYRIPRLLNKFIYNFSSWPFIIETSKHLLFPVKPLAIHHCLRNDQARRYVDKLHLNKNVHMSLWFTILFLQLIAIDLKVQEMCGLCLG
jgi:hypothetical protein